MALQICLQPVSNNKFNVSLETVGEFETLVIEGYSNLSFSDAIDKVKSYRKVMKQKKTLN